MADVFISYKREDAARVGKLVAALRSRGLEAWWDEDIPPGAKWEATIEQELARAKTVIACWTPASVASDNVRSEARVAREAGRLIQVFLKPCKPPLFFGEEQAVDLTGWRGNAGDPRIARLAETVRKVAAGERVAGVERPSSRRGVSRRAAAALVAILIVAAGLAGWWLLRPAQPSGPTTLAVLPFRSLNPGDANLVDAIWDDTRGAIGRNPNLRVLARETVERLAAKHLEPADYRRKVGAEYLLDGSVQHVGDQVQMKLSLVRTKDGTELWSDQLGGKLDDVFAFQQRIASEVEGRIRGRLAPGGGTTAKNIATSAEVYSLFAEARAKMRQRGKSVGEAIPILKKAVAIDPNYAPAWAELAKATKYSGDGDTADEASRKATAYAQRALTLAPNLADAHAALGFVKGADPEAETELRRAIALDPGTVEAWMWLGNHFLMQNRVAKALEAHSRAVELDPLWFNSMFNKMDDLVRLRDMNGLAAEVRRAESTGDEHLILLAREHAAELTGHLGAAGRLLAQFRRKFPEEGHKWDAAVLLVQLGYIDEAAKLVQLPASVTASLKGTPESPQQLRSEFKDPAEFWGADDRIDAPAMRYARLLPKHGRLAEYVGYYNAAFRNPDEFYETADWPGGGTRFLRIAPNAAANLHAGGQPQAADAIVEKAESIIEPELRNGPPENELLVMLAQLRGAEGRDGEVVPILAQAVARGWLPDRVYYSADIADEPCFARLVNRVDFQALRRRIFARYDEERRALGPVEQLLTA